MRSTPLYAIIVGLVLAGALILASSRGDVDRMTYGDGLIYRYVASHFATDPSDVHPVVVERGASLRYGRVGLPALIWLGSAGQPVAMPYVQPLLMMLAGGAASAAVVRLLPRAGPLGAVVPFLAPGFSIAVAGGFAEAAAVAFSLWAVVFAREERWAVTTLLLAAAILTRENAGAVLIGIAIWVLLRRRVGLAAALSLSVIPTVAWYGFVAWRYGHLPILDPYLRVATDTIGLPVVAIGRALTDSTASATMTAALHLGLALVAFVMWRRSIAGAIAAAAGLQVLAAGPFSFVFEGEAFRQFVLLQLFLILALFWSRWSEPSDRNAPAA